jgi:hypothetical protein
MLFQVIRQLLDGCPTTPGLPLCALIRANACLQSSRPQTSFINCSLMVGLSAPLRRERFGPFPFDTAWIPSELHSAFVLEANSSWFFCRLSLISRAAYLPLPSTPCRDRSGLHRFRDHYALC